MRKNSLFAWFTALALLGGGHVENARAECSTLDGIGWMLGYWSARGETMLTTESWTRVSDKTWEGFGRTFSLPDFQLRATESMRLLSMSGGVFYLPKVAHNEYPVPFRLTACGNDLAVFENPDHDFPTRLAYVAEGPGSVRVDVSGPDGNGFSIPLQADSWAANRRIALTFDDAPRGDSRRLTGQERTRRLIDSLARAGSPPVMFFATAKNVDEQGSRRLNAYQAAGHHIANHSFTHRRINDLGVEAYLEDIARAHDVLSGYERFVPLFRFPFLDEGRDEETRDRLRAGLAELGYRNGYVTVDNYDFAMDSLLQRAVEQGREIHEDKLGQAYVEALMQGVRFYDDMARRWLNEPPAHVLLLHENDLAAMYVDELIVQLRDEGWTLVDAREAYEGDAWLPEPDTLFNNQGRLAALAEARGAARSDLIHPLEDTAALEIYLEKQGAFGAPYPERGKETLQASDYE